MRYALVKDGVVRNVVNWDGVAEWAPPVGYECLECPSNVGPRWTYSNGEFSPPASEPVTEGE